LDESEFDFRNALIDDKSDDVVVFARRQIQRSWRNHDGALGNVQGISRIRQPQFHEERPRPRIPRRHGEKVVSRSLLGGGN
jgi:hypothetical protein